MNRVIEWIGEGNNHKIVGGKQNNSPFEKGSDEIVISRK